LTPEDLGLPADQLPPDTLVSLGEKQLINPVALREFSTLRSAARRQCLVIGTRFMGGYLIPAQKARLLLQKLSELEQQYNDKRAAFLARFDHLIQDWTAKQPPEWQKLIREALVPAEYVGERLSFAVQAVRLGKPEPEIVEHHGLDRAVSGLSGQLFHEIGVVAREALEKSFHGKREVTRRALSPFKAIRDKLEGLTFIDSRFRVVVREIDRLLAEIPPKQAIKGPMLQELSHFLSLAAQPDRIKAFAEHRGVADTPEALLMDGLDLGLWSDEDHSLAAQAGSARYEHALEVESDSMAFEAEPVAASSAEEAMSVETDEAFATQVEDGDDWFFG
jgi:hypothetical protein